MVPGRLMGCMLCAWPPIWRTRRSCGSVHRPVKIVDASRPPPRHVAILRGLVEAHGVAGNLTTDAHLAALALEHGAELVTFDRDILRFGVKLELLA